MSWLQILPVPALYPRSVLWFRRLYLTGLGSVLLVQSRSWFSDASESFIP